MYGAIEAGGTKLVCAVGNEDFKIVERISFATTTPDETMEHVFNFFNKFNIKAIGIGSFGPIDINVHSETYGYVMNTPKLAWKSFDFIGAIRSQFNVPIGWTTDVIAAALSEATLGAGEGLRSVLYLTVGTGVGGGAIVNGKILEGFSHPEMGHIKVQQHPGDLFIGQCPYHKNCLEGLAAGPTIEARINKKGHELEADHEVWDFLADYLAQALYTYTVTLSPEKIVLGGGVMKKECLLPKVRSNLVRLIGNYVEIPPIESYIVNPELGDDAGVVGGIILAIREFEKRLGGMSTLN